MKRPLPFDAVTQIAEHLNTRSMRTLSSSFRGMLLTFLFLLAGMGWVQAQVVNTNPSGVHCSGNQVAVGFNWSGIANANFGSVSVQLLDGITNPFLTIINPDTISSAGGSSSVTVQLPALAPSGNFSLRVTPAGPAGPALNTGSITIRGLSITLPWGNGKVFCPGETWDVNFATNDVLGVGNIFLVELSNNVGGFGTPTVIGQLASTQQMGTIKAAIPYSQGEGGGYRIRVRATTVAEPGCEYGNYSVLQMLPFVTQPADQLVCLNQTANFNSTANGVAAGAGATYRWEQVCTDPFTNKADSNGLATSALQDVHIDGMNIWAATGAGVSISTNGGNTWATFDQADGLADDLVNAVFYDPVGGVFYAATNQGVSRSTGSPTNPSGFTNFGLPVLPSNNITDVSAAGMEIFVASIGGISISTDGGGTWSNQLAGIPVSTVFVSNPGTPNRAIYAGSSQGLHIARFNSTSFAAPIQVAGPGSPAPLNVINDVFVDGNGAIVVGTNFGVRYSIDGGATWNHIVNGLDNQVVYSVYIHGGKIFAGTADGLAVANMGSNSFVRYTDQWGLGNNFVRRVYARAGGGGIEVFAATLGGLSSTVLTTSDLTDGGNIMGATTQNLSINPVQTDNARCRYQLKVTRISGAFTCAALSNLVTLADIPPAITADSIPAGKCTAPLGGLVVKGMLPGVKYNLKWERDGTALPDTMITGGADGTFKLVTLDTGIYKLALQSLVQPMCVGDTVMVRVPGPPKPVLGTLPTATACQGSQVTITMPALMANEQYEWFTDMGATMQASPTSSGVNFTPFPVPTTDGSYYVRIRNTSTQCLSDTQQVMFTLAPKPAITCTPTHPASSPPATGSILIQGLDAADTYTLTYVDPNGATQTVTPITGVTSYTINGLVAGSYNNIKVTNAQGCESNILSCPLIPQDLPTPVMGNAGAPVNSVDSVCGVNSGFFQNNEPPLACTGPDAHFPSSLAATPINGIAVGRIRDPKAIIPDNPNAPSFEQSNVELRGWLQFNLREMVPPHAYIERIEYLPVAVNTFGQFVCDIQLESATGDLQFDVTRMDSLNYANTNFGYFGYDAAANTDIFNEKYNDFVISRDTTGPWVDLGPRAVEDAQARLRANGYFQIGLHLSGSDFDIPQYQFHGIVFAPGTRHKLRITYHIRDYGDHLEPKYTTDLTGSVSGPYHRIDSIDVNPDLNITDIQPTMYIGATVPDGEIDGQPTFLANGDDNDNVDDEDLSQANFVDSMTNVPAPIIAGEHIQLRIPVTNNLTINANLYAFIDWNDDGDFEDANELYFKTVMPTDSVMPAIPAGQQDTVEFDITVPPRATSDTIGVRVRFTSATLTDANGGAPNGEVEDFRIEVQALDFGDLPDMTAGIGANNYQTRFLDNGARHGVPVVPLVFLGDRVDTELDGQENAEANGDDNDNSLDDEDGIVFLTPLIPGQPAKFSYRATNNTNKVGRLWVFADWTNNGVLDTVTSVNIPAGPFTTPIPVVTTFTVPDTATWAGGFAFFRFRITTDTAFNNSAAHPYGVALDGEVEDYYIPMFKAGNLVWEDRNHNGFQDPEEISLGIDSVRVVLRYGGVDSLSGAFDSINQNTLLDPNTLALGGGGDIVTDYVLDTYTDSTGRYCFVGLIEGLYQLIAIDTFALTPTRADHIDNVTEEDRDSDGRALRDPWSPDYDLAGAVRQSKTQVFLMHRDSIGTDEEGILDQGNPQLLDPNALNNYPDARYEQRIDFGYTAFDFADLPETYTTSEDGVTIGVNQKGLFPTDTVLVGNPLEGPKHIVTPEVYLGKCSDAELEGQPDSDAGQQFASVDGLGDDPNNSVWDSNHPQDTCVDDEDGVLFMTPLIPGYEAIINVDYYTTINNDGPDAYFQAYIDWNGDGDFYVNGDPAQGVDTLEHILFTKLNGNAAPIEPNTWAVELETSYQNSPIQLAFNVPDTTVTKFANGNILSRFRIGKEPNLGPAGILPGNANFPDGVVPRGETEDKFMKLTKVGNLVWEDRNYNGRQDIGEPGIAGIPIQLDFYGIDTLQNGDIFEKTYTTVTDSLGRYYFCGLIGNVNPSGIASPRYRLTVRDSASMTPTIDKNPIIPGALSNCDPTNSDGIDSVLTDSITWVTFRIENPMGLCTGELAPVGLQDQMTLNMFPDNQIDETFDFGFTGFDYGDLPDTSIAAQYRYLTKRDWLPTAPIDFGPRHAIQPRLYLGSGVDAELDGKPDDDAGSKAGGDDDMGSQYVKGTGADDENGIRLLTPLLPGEIAYIKVNYTSQDTNLIGGGYTNRDAFLNAFLDFNGDGDLDDATDSIKFTFQGPDLANMTALGVATANPQLPGGLDTMQVLAFMVPDTSITDFSNGVAFMRFRLSWQGKLGPNNNAFHTVAPPHVDTMQVYPRGEVEDYGIPLAKIGNLAWYDHNVNGHQDDSTLALYNQYMDRYGVDTLHLVLIWGGVNPTTGMFDSVGYFDQTMSSAGMVPDVLYNLTIPPQTPPNYTPNPILKTNKQGLYSFHGLIPGNYNLIPLKYLQTDSASFVDFWPKHRVLTLKDNPLATDSSDSDAGPGILFMIADSNSREPEVCVDDLPLGENGQLDTADQQLPLYPDSLWDKTLDLGWVDEPNIEANLDIVGVNYPFSDSCIGSFNVIMHLCVKNPQEVPLDSLVMSLNLRQAYGDAFIATSKPVVTIVDSAYTKDSGNMKVRKSMVGAKDSLTKFINPNYNGDSDTKLLTGGDYATGFFLPGDSVVCVQIEFEIDPNKTGSFPWMSQAEVWARAVGFRYDPTKLDSTKAPLIDWFPKSPRFRQAIQVYDKSDEFDDPMPMAGLMYPQAGDSIIFEGMVADRGDRGEYQLFTLPPNITGRDKYLDEDDKTIQNDSCWIKTFNLSGQDDIIVGLDMNCQALITADDVIYNYDPKCDFPNYPMGSYYRIIIQDSHTGQTLWTSADRVPFDASQYLHTELIYKLKSVANSCTEVWGRITVEDKKGPMVTCAVNTDSSFTTKLKLVCSDIDSVLNNAKTWTDATHAYYTGVPTATDNCGQAYLRKVSDELKIFTDCQEAADTGYYAVIKRTFTYRDDFDNTTTCMQLIYFSRPVIVLPKCEILVPNNLAGNDTIITPKDLVGKYNQPEAVPYFINGAGKKVFFTMGQDFCGISYEYENSDIFPNGECGKKMIRTWKLFDWCYAPGRKGVEFIPRTGADTCHNGLMWSNNQLIWEQKIIIGDSTAPIVLIPDLDKDGFKGSGYKGGPAANPNVQTASYDPGDRFMVGTNPDDCTSRPFDVKRNMFEVIEQSDWCFEVEVLVRRPILNQDELPTGMFEMVTDDNVQVVGSCEQGYTVWGMAKPFDTLTQWFIKVRFYDVCKKDTTIYVPIDVKDDVEPVMACDDNLNVTFDNFGNAKVSVEDVDEGSWDNCLWFNWMKVRRPVAGCAEGFQTLTDYVDANGNGIVDTQDYIDENHNNKADPLEYFGLDQSGKILMSPLLDEVPFFCCDADSVVVELWGEDKAGNRSYCWTYVHLDDKPPLYFELPDDYTLPNDVAYNCTQETERIDLLKAGRDTFLEGSAGYVAIVALFGGDIVIPNEGTCAGFVKEIVAVPDFDHCGEGEIEVYWRLRNSDRLIETPKRKIKVGLLHDYSICFPADVKANCSEPTIPSVTYDERGCDLLAVATVDEIFPATADSACYKIFRTYRVINWCEYDGSDVPVIVERDWNAKAGHKAGLATGDNKSVKGDEENHVTVDGVNNGTAGNGICVIVHKETRADSWNPGTGQFATQIGGKWVNASVWYDNDFDRSNGYYWYVNDEDVSWDDPNVGGNNSDDDHESRYGSFGYWQYTQHIAVYDNVKPEVRISADTSVICSNDNTGCNENVTFTIHAKDLCVGVGGAADSVDVSNFRDYDAVEVVWVRIEGQTIDGNSERVAKVDDTTFTVTFNEVRFGYYTAEVRVTDGCGNFAEASYAFQVKDCKAPTPIAIDTLAVELMPSEDTTTGGGMMAVWATDFVASAIFDCNGQDTDSTNASGQSLVTKYSLNRVGDTVRMDQGSVEVTCADVGAPIALELHAWDEEGNHGYVVVWLNVQDNMGVCDGTTPGNTEGQIAGTIATESDQMIDGVEVRLSGDQNAIYTTDNSGQYAFNRLPLGSDYSIIPAKDVGHGQGVTTFDVILIQKHIIGSTPLSGPYKKIAADVNKSGTITTGDIIQLRRLILNLDSRFRDNTSWRFVDANYGFANADQAMEEAFPEVWNVNNLAGREQVNFVGMKIGDVNNTAMGSVQPRAAERLMINVDAGTDVLRAGQTYTLRFTTDQLASIQGYQFTLEVPELQIVDVVEGLAGASHLGVFAEEGLITTSWNQPAEALMQGELFGLVVQPRRDIELSRALRVSSRLTPAEGYNDRDEVMEVRLTYNDLATGGAETELYQNRPNPFNRETVIGFRLGTPGRATIKIWDVAGKLIKQIEGDYGSGYHEMQLKHSELPSAGVFYYTLEADKFMATRRMILME